MEEGAKLAASQNNNNEVGDGMQCIHHPHHTNTSNPGAICAFCLQEKLGKLLSSSFPSPPPPSSSSPSPSPSFTPPPPPLSLKTNHHTRSRIPFLVQNKNNTVSTKNKKPSTTSNCSSSGNIIFKRSKSTVTSTRNHTHFIHHDHDFFSPRKRNGFWSFLYPSSKEAKSPNGKQRGKCSGQTQRKSDHVIMEEEKCFSSSSSKVSRSRSVGCGSRSFSADFFERISSGLGDCTLRRVESHREGKHKVVASASSASSSSSSSSSSAAGGGGVVNHCMKERVRCGGIFGGFAVTSSSSSASSSSWVSSTVDDGRGRSWGWAFASPIRAFTTKGSSSSKRDASDKNATPNLSAIPSLLTVRG
ncbi:hypothetical protein V8G54_008727 [Vigna mungo]|uniref:Uncharacterized protein n=1 Tax=Vigna mungo TaxID=3915 RepID=A0AAQ3P4D9_VIGMU